MSNAGTSGRLAQWIPRLYQALLVVFLGAIVLFFAGKDTAGSLPSIENQRPAGLMLLADVLRSRGHQVVVSRQKSPKLKPDDVLVYVSTSNSFQEFEDAIPSPSLLAGQDSIRLAIYDGDLRQAMEQQGGPEAPVRWAGGQSKTDGKMEFQSSDPGFGSSGRNLLLSENQALAQLESKSTGHRELNLLAGTAAINLLVHKADNADFIVGMFEGMNRKKGRFVFWEYGIGNRQDNSLMQDLGNSFSVAYWQIILVGAVIIFSVGKRFGPPLPPSLKVRGTRELVDAFGDVLWRQKRTDIALQLIYDNLDLRVRRAANLAPGASLKDRDEHLPPEVAGALRGLAQAAQSNLDRTRGRIVAQAALAAVEGFEKQQRTRR